MKRIVILIYGLTCYVAFIGILAYSIGFLGNFLVPKSIDSPREVSLARAIVINTALLALFALQHSVMARPAFKRWWTRIVPEPAERSTYVLFSCIALAALFIFWQPMGGVIWNFTSPAARAIAYTFFAVGWGIVLLATFLINHFDLFGLRQVCLYFRNQPYVKLTFVTPWLYRIVRHPLYVGWIVVFWSTPTMTAAHAFFALVTTAYILVAIQLEEHDLKEHFGEKYDEYRRQVPMLIPSPARRCSESERATSEAPTASPI